MGKNQHVGLGKALCCAVSEEPGYGMSLGWIFTNIASTRRIADVVSLYTGGSLMRTYISRSIMIRRSSLSVPGVR
jgi:hypothetical protein